MSAAVPASERVVAAIDQGTTSTRCLLFTRSGRMVAVAQREHRQYFPAPGRAEHDATEIWRAVTRVVPAALRRAGLGPENVAALGIANQRETTVVWNRHTGVPLARAITWQDTRTDGIVSGLADSAGLYSEVSGLGPATYFAGPRLQWLLDHVPGARDGAERGDVLFGTMESWLIWNLTGGPNGGVHVTDVTNASRTMLMDLRTLEWSPRLCAALRVPPQMLPRIVPNAQVYGTCTGLLPGVPVAGALGDQQAALVGQTCFAPGEAKCTYGTGAFLLKNTGPRIASSDAGLIPTVGYLLGDRPVYALEGSIAMTGSLVQWFRDALGMISTAARIETLALSVPDNGGCYVVPAFSGLYAPHWNPDARGVIVGLTSYIHRGHLARAVLEATAWQTREVLDAMNRDSGVGVTRLKVDGGMTANHLLMQCLADVLDLTVERPLGSEAVSLGAAYAAGLAVGYWPDPDVLRRNWHRAAAWEPAMDPGLREREHVNWRRAVERSIGWARSG
ncbi:glycerol kinase GlpK [Pseudonocardia parietis]|uniref:ATP:glycerol 3-phosphotransferase n=1 Tax=Pseudonocardia parietis TaxID=570936 RepID=A0ABS4W2C6_9PSEU|nr:glycerol kinase GlpK [Pseudonocardia parietis]MBP2370363.1 glycerol kinase [Pseudonocardia parietis]